MTVLLTVLAVCALITLAVAIAADLAWLYGLITRQVQFGNQWGAASDAEVAVYGDVLRGEVIDSGGVPIVAVRAVVEPDEIIGSAEWQARRARYANFITDFPAALYRAGVHLPPTAEYKLVVAQQFGVELTTVGPREVDLHCTRHVLRGGAWRQEELDLQGAQR